MKIYMTPEQINIYWKGLIHGFIIGGSCVGIIILSYIYFALL